MAREYSTEDVKPNVSVVDITELVPDDRNFNRGTQYGKHLLEKSFGKFGAGRSVLLDRNNRIIAGNKSTEQYGESGGEKVIVVETDGTTLVAVKRTDIDLGTSRGREMALADNRVAQVDIDLDLEAVEEELKDIGTEEWGLAAFGGGFAAPDNTEPYSSGDAPQAEQTGQVRPAPPVVGAERGRTDDAYNLSLFDPERCTGPLQMPMLEPERIEPPKRLVGFNYARSSGDGESGIHFFIDDYQFERVWNRPEENSDVLKFFRCALTPDFSLYSDMPLAMMVWNVYRSRLIGQWWQGQNMHVIPTVSWAGEDSFRFCFDGIPRRSIVAVSTVGAVSNRDMFEKGFSEMAARLEPRTIMLYGTDAFNSFVKGFRIPTVLYKSSFTNRNSDGYRIV